MLVVVSSYQYLRPGCLDPSSTSASLQPPGPLSLTVVAQGDGPPRRQCQRTRGYPSWPLAHGRPAEQVLQAAYAVLPKVTGGRLEQVDSLPVCVAATNWETSMANTTMKHNSTPREFKTESEQGAKEQEKSLIKNQWHPSYASQSTNT